MHSCCNSWSYTTLTSDVGLSIVVGCSWTAGLLHVALGSPMCTPSLEGIMPTANPQPSDAYCRHWLSMSCLVEKHAMCGGCEVWVRKSSVNLARSAPRRRGRISSHWRRAQRDSNSSLLQLLSQRCISRDRIMP